MNNKLVSINLPSPIGIKSHITRAMLYILFFCSGCSALIYQVMWERMLFTLFGVDLQSITMIVAVFMFGLGMGGLYGGKLADQFPKKLLKLYIGIELGIAIFGYFSPYLINTVGNLFIIDNKFFLALLTFLLLAFPTILFGATFPILVTHVNQLLKHVGNSVGNLYFANTLGGAMGAYFAGFALLYIWDLPQAVNCAAFINMAIAFLAWILFRKEETC